MATTALVDVTTGVMKPLLSKLTKLLEQEYVKLKGLRKQIKFLRDELSAMSATLQVLADAEQLDPETREWRDKLRELAYDLEDCIDAFMVRVGHEPDGRSGFKRFFRKLKKLKARHEIANQIEELKASVIEASERHKRYDLVAQPQLKHKSSSSSVDPRLQALYEDIDKLVGIDAPTKHITGLLNMEMNGSSAKLKVVSIAGCGGLWYIVVIDDVWNAEDWGFIKLALPNNDLGSRIITTTRSVTIAKYCSSQVYEMEALSFDDSKRLFFRGAFGSENSCYPHLEDVPDKILRKCGGLPLAIVTVSGILYNELQKEEWDRVLNAIGSALAKKPDAKTMTSILSLSYFDIPHHLRTCLLYLSVYPEDYVIEKQCLINRWIAEGFIHEEEGKTKHEIGEGYFNDLINRSMIQPVKVKYGQAKACRVHDIIVLDYIKCKVAEENFITFLNPAEPVHTSEYKVRRLCVRNQNEENVTFWVDQILSHVRSVTISGQTMKISLLPSTALRVLDLGDCRGMQDHHLASIEQLILIKYLRLCSYSIIKLPENVGELQHLQTLDVRGTVIKELPRTITKLQQLERLYVDWDARFPDGTTGQIRSLEELREYGIQSYEQGKSIQEFSKLVKLRTLKIKWDFDLPDGLEGISQALHIHSYVGSLLSSCNLHNLIYTKSTDSLLEYPLALHSWYPAASCSIRKLCIRRLPIYRVPNWMGSLGNLGVLELTIICVRPEDVKILGEISSLVFLNLVTFGGTSGRIVFPGNNGFRSLKYFSMCILFCGTSLDFEAGPMSKLEHVKLQFHAHKIECLNGPSSLGIQHLLSLSKVEIKICSYKFEYDGNYNPAEDDRDDTVRCVSRAINAAIKTLPNRPTVRFTRKYGYCKHFESALRELNQESEWLLNE